VPQNENPSENVVVSNLCVWYLKPNSVLRFDSNQTLVCNWAWAKPKYFEFDYNMLVNFLAAYILFIEFLFLSKETSLLVGVDGMGKEYAMGYRNMTL
jgi:hypothetical protein